VHYVEKSGKKGAGESLEIRVYYQEQNCGDSVGNRQTL